MLLDPYYKIQWWYKILSGCFWLFTCWLLLKLLKGELRNF